MNRPADNLNESADLTVTSALAGDATAPGQARRFVRETLLLWRLPALVESCVLVASELVTNAVRHGIPPFGLLMRRRSESVRIDVNDARPQPLVASGGIRADLMAESGRGLSIVRELADDLGCEPVPGDGKNVYASWKFDAAPPAQATDAYPTGREPEAAL